MKSEKDTQIKKNRILAIEADNPGSTDYTRLKKTLFILVSIVTVSAAIIFIVTNILYRQPESFISQILTPDSDIFDSTSKVPEFQSDNIHIKRGRDSYARGYLTDAVSEFNEVIESDSSDKDKAIALTYLGIISEDRSEFDKAVEYYTRALKFNDKDPFIYRNMAQAYRKMQKFDRAIEYASEALKLNGDDPDSLLLLGNIYFETARYDDAARHYQNALKSSPDNPALLYNLGITLLHKGDNFAGAEYLKKAASSDKIGEIAHRAYARLGLIYTEMNNYEEAQKYLSSAVSIRPADPVNRYNLGIVYLRQNKKESALAEFIKAEELGAKDSAMLENLGDAFSALGDYDRSLSNYQKLIDINSRNVKILSRMAEIYYEQGKLDQALAAFSRITKIEPASENARIAYLNIGNILDDTGRFDEAIDAYNKALALNPKDSDAYYNLGLSYKNAEKPELAIQSWRKGAELNRKDPKNALAVADYYYEKNMYDLAEREYETIISRWPEIQEPHFKLATLNYRREKLDAALAGFTRVIELDPQTDFARRALINSAVISMKAGGDEKSLDKAVNQIQRALMLKSNDGEALFSLGIIYYRAEMFDRAIESFLQSVRSTSDTELIADAYNNIGKSYYKKRDYRKAMQNFQRAVEENPSKEEYRINRKTASEAYESLVSER